MGTRRSDVCVRCFEQKEIAARGLCYACYRQAQRSVGARAAGISPASELRRQKKMTRAYTQMISALLDFGAETYPAAARLTSMLGAYLPPLAAYLGEAEPSDGGQPNEGFDQDDAASGITTDGDVNVNHESEFSCSQNDPGPKDKEGNAVDAESDLIQEATKDSSADGADSPPAVAVDPGSIQGETLRAGDPEWMKAVRLEMEKKEAKKAATRAKALADLESASEKRKKAVDLILRCVGNDREHAFSMEYLQKREEFLRELTDNFLRKTLNLLTGAGKLKRRVDGYGCRWFHAESRYCR